MRQKVAPVPKAIEVPMDVRQIHFKEVVCAVETLISMLQQELCENLMDKYSEGAKELPAIQ